jgi:hypothetical protein
MCVILRILGEVIGVIRVILKDEDEGLMKKVEEAETKW